MKEHDNTTESLSRYIKQKLGLPVSVFCREQGIPPATLYSRWSSPKGRENIENMVFRIYVKKFEDL